MRNLRHRISVTLCLVFLTFYCSAQESATLQITGEVEKLELTRTDLAKMPRLAIDVHNPHSGEAEHYEGVRLSDLLSKAGAPLGEKLRGKALATYVLARAADGYSVVYSLAELDPAMNGNTIILADTLNGKPLDQKEGPFKVVVPGEKRAARWARMVVGIEVLNAINPARSSLR